MRFSTTLVMVLVILMGCRPTENVDSGASPPPPPAPLDNSTETATPPESVDYTLSKEQKEALLKLGDLFTAQQLTLRAGTPAEQVTEALAGFADDRILALARLSAALSNFGADDLEPVLNAFLVAVPPADEKTTDAYRLLFRRWAEIDGSGAIDAAFAALPENAVRIGAGIEAMKTWAEHNIAETAHHIASLPEGFGRASLNYALPYEYARQNPSAALTWAKNLPTDLRNTALQHTSIAWLSHNTADAMRGTIALAKEAPPSEDPALLDPIFTETALHLVRQGEADTAKWLAALPPGRARQQAMITALDWWVDFAPEQADAWLRTYPPEPSMDPVIESYARRLAPADPEGAAIWTASLSDESIRSATLHQVLATWNVNNPEKAAAWANASGNDKIYRDVIKEEERGFE